VDWIERAKKKAALEAAQLVEDGFVIGLGSGSTVAYVIEEIGKRIRGESLRILGVPTSHQASLLAIENCIPLTTLGEHPQLDLAIDGADQIDKELNLIKGMGGALTREKIVAYASKNFVIVADEKKLVDKLGTNQPVPLELLPFALSTVMSKIKEMGGKPVLREAKGKVGPVITDNGNFIIDAEFAQIPELKELNTRLKLIPGVIETGLFIEMADVVYLGTPTSVKRLKRKK